MDFQQPPPKGWDQFEDLCADIFREEWRDPMVVRHGRAGQPQNGVDIVGRHGSDWPIGVQCKNKSVWPVKRVTTAELDNEVAKARLFRPPLKAFYLVSTAPNDEALQAHARMITKTHLAQGLFPVAVFGWDEIERRAKRHPAVAARHFGAYAAGPNAPLLATWRADAGKLLMADDELAVAIRELIHELREFPEGRIVFRQRESDDLQLKIQVLQAGTKGAIHEREAILAERDALKMLEDRERRVTRGLGLLLGRDPLRDEVRFVWDEHAAAIVRAFVEQEIDPEHDVVTGLEKIRLLPPDDPDNPIAVYVPPCEIGVMWDFAHSLERRYPELDTDVIGELAPSVRYGHAIPAVLSRVTTRVAEGSSLEDLVRRKWLDMHAWKVEY